MITKKIAGGQTGADRGGLNVAITLVGRMVVGVLMDAKRGTGLFLQNITSTRWLLQNICRVPKPISLTPMQQLFSRMGG
jgi:hypothetical protein